MEKTQEELEKSWKRPDSLLSFSCCMSNSKRKYHLSRIHLDYPGYSKTAIIIKALHAHIQKTRGAKHRDCTVHGENAML